MIRILLIRHGATDLLGRVLYGRMPGVHLSAEGHKQVHRLAHALHGRFHIKEVISSPMERALETAQAIASLRGLPISTDEGLNEIDFGSWKGKAFTELTSSEDWQRYNQHRSLSSPPGGEFMTQVQTRAWSALERIVARHSNLEDSAISVVTHGDVIRVLVILFLGMSLDHLHRLEIAPASVSEISLGAGSPRVRTINQIFD